MWKDTHCLPRTLSKSSWSFLDSPDIRQVFTGFILHTDGETYLTEPSDGFVDTFMDLLFYINTCPPGTPINVEWNKNLPYYVLTCDTGLQDVYWSAERHSIRLWLPDRLAQIIPALAWSQKHVRFPCSRNGILHHYGSIQKWDGTTEPGTKKKGKLHRKERAIAAITAL